MLINRIAATPSARRTHANRVRTRRKGCVNVHNLGKRSRESAALRPRLLAAFGGAARGKGEPERLTLGRKVEHSIERGEKQLFVVGLDGGQFARVVVKQRGVDLVVGVRGPGGDNFEVDTQDGMHGPEFVSLVASATGDYVSAPLFEVEGRHAGTLRDFAGERLAEIKRAPSERGHGGFTETWGSCVRRCGRRGSRSNAARG